MDTLIRLVLAGDDALARDGLRALVAAHPGLRVVGEAESGEEAWRQACELRPDVLVLDLSLPRSTVLDLAERIARDCPTVRIVAITIHEERGHVTRLLRAGAAGYLLKRTVSPELVRAIRAVAAGGKYVDPGLAGALLDQPSGAPREGRPGGRPDLTPREEDVLRLVTRGYSNKEIAQKLDIGLKTVETHKANGLARLGLTSRAALVRYGVEEGWLSGEE